MTALTKGPTPVPPTPHDAQPEVEKMARTAKGPDDLSGPTRDRPLAHKWVVLAEVRVSEKVVKHANLRGSFRTVEGQRVDSLDEICKACRRHYEDVADEPCQAPIDNEHLIGGNPGERAKRKVHKPVGPLSPGPRINRRGVAAVVAGGATFTNR